MGAEAAPISSAGRKRPARRQDPSSFDCFSAGSCRHSSPECVRGR